VKDWSVTGGYHILMQFQPWVSWKNPGQQQGPV